MIQTICSKNPCEKCPWQKTCPGCIKTLGKPFGGSCVTAECAKARGLAACAECKNPCALKREIITECNTLGIKDMPKVSDLVELSGAYVNLEYTLPSGAKVKFLDDTKIYLGTQIELAENKCIGIVADKDLLLICTYEEQGANPKLLLYKQRR